MSTLWTWQRRQQLLLVLVIPMSLVGLMTESIVLVMLHTESQVSVQLLLQSQAQGSKCCCSLQMVAIPHTRIRGLAGTHLNRHLCQAMASVWSTTVPRLIRLFSRMLLANMPHMNSQMHPKGRLCWPSLKIVWVLIAGTMGQPFGTMDIVLLVHFNWDRPALS